MRAVNLLPADAYAPKQRLPYARVVLAGTAPVLACALVYLGYSIEHSTVTDRQIALGAIQSQIAAAGPSPELVKQTGMVASERSSREAALVDALGKQIPWDVLFDQVSRVLPANAWLTTFNVQSPTPAASPATAAPGPVSIQGETYSLADVAQVLARLALVPSLSDVSLVSTATVPRAEGKETVQFDISAAVRGSGS